jgi:hypothetical protein
MSRKRGKGGGRGKKTPDVAFPTQEAIDAAQKIVEIASSPSKCKALSPEDDEEDLDAALQEAIENDDYLYVAKEDKAHHTKKLAEYTEKQSKINAANSDLSAGEKKELKSKVKAKITHMNKALKRTESLIKNRRAEICAEIAQEFEERERAQKRRKTEQEDPWHISSGKHRHHSTTVTHVPIGYL